MGDDRQGEDYCGVGDVVEVDFFLRAGVEDYVDKGFARIAGGQGLIEGRLLLGRRKEVVGLAKKGEGKSE